MPNLGIFQSFESSFISVTLAFPFLRDAVTIAFLGIALSIFELPMMQFADAAGWKPRWGKTWPFAGFSNATD